LARKKNLSKDDLEDVSIYEEINQRKYSTFDPNKIRINDISIELKCLQKKQKDLRRAIEEKDIVIANGAPGTGKTYMSLATALHILKTEPKYKKIVLIKSLQIIKGEEIGYLPGTLWEKLEPYMYSFTGNLDKILGSSSITKALLNQGIIEIFPIAYVRGCTLDRSIVIVDESQNLDMHMFKTIITRIGNNCKMIFLGDSEQVDRKIKTESCLYKVAELFKNFEQAASITFTNEESVRNPIIPKILQILQNEN
jgi:phosphate starvation-inducible PhoH-like protein